MPSAAWSRRRHRLPRPIVCHDSRDPKEPDPDEPWQVTLSVSWQILETGIAIDQGDYTGPLVRDPLTLTYWGVTVSDFGRAVVFTLDLQVTPANTGLTVTIYEGIDIWWVLAGVANGWTGVLGFLSDVSPLSPDDGGGSFFFYGVDAIP